MCIVRFYSRCTHISLLLSALPSSHSLSLSITLENINTMTAKTYQAIGEQSSLSDIDSHKKAHSNPKWNVLVAFILFAAALVIALSSSSTTSGTIRSNISSQDVQSVALVATSKYETVDCDDLPRGQHVNHFGAGATIQDGAYINSDRSEKDGYFPVYRKNADCQGLFGINCAYGDGW